MHKYEVLLKKFFSGMLKNVKNIDFDKVGDKDFMDSSLVKKNSKREH